MTIEFVHENPADQKGIVIYGQTAGKKKEKSFQAMLR